MTKMTKKQETPEQRFERAKEAYLNGYKEGYMACLKTTQEMEKKE